MNILAPNHRFPCDTCGSDMRFDPASGAMVCDHCGNREQVTQAAPTAIRELDFRAAIEAQLPSAEMEETRVSACPNCGAEVEFDADLHATECPFCATPVVTDTGTHRHIKPRGLVPFTLNEAASRKAMNDWLGSLWFAPGGLQDYARKGRRMQGIYVPYWTFDADTQSAYRGERGTVYYETRTVMRGGKRETRRVAKVRWRRTRGRVRRAFDDVLVLASTSLPKRFTDALAPWDLSGLEPYGPSYLAGFRAEGYQVQLDEGFVQARAQMDAQIARDVRFDIGGGPAAHPRHRHGDQRCDVQACAAARLAGGLQIPRAHVPVRGQRTIGPGAGRAALVGDKDCLCGGSGADRGGDCRLCDGAAGIDAGLR